MIRPAGGRRTTIGIRNIAVHLEGVVLVCEGDYGPGNGFIGSMMNLFDPINSALVCVFL